MIGNEPSIFNGEREQVEEFLTTWNLYQGLNRNTTVMRVPFDRAQLFLGYIRGPQVKAWVQDTSQLIAEHIAFGGRDTDEWIWTTVINDFAKTFQDHMSKDLARGDIFTLKMERGDIDKYVADFKHVVRMGEYNIDETMVCQKFFQGLPKGLQGSMINFEPIDRFTHFSDWVEAAIRQHKKYQRWQNVFGGTKSQPQKPFRQKPTRQQWQQKFAKDPNAMDLTPGRTRARAALTEEEQVTLQKEGRCFNCKKQGHIGRNCPLKAGGSKAQSGETTENTDQTHSSIKRLTADDLINIVQGMDKGEKDKIIQEVFMKEDFA